MSAPRIHDLVGIGIGPFNLGLACLSDPLDVDAVFLDQNPGFSWHPGMMLKGSTIQVPFMADLVTMADPTSRFSFLNWLKRTGRLYPFYIRESFYPLRAEYDAYCRWACGELDTLRWGRRVVAVAQDAALDCFRVSAELQDGSVEQHLGRHVVLGIGSQPYVPAAFAPLGERVVHSSAFLDRADEIAAARSVTVVGSGQSAAEIYRSLLDTLDQPRRRVDWITRAPRFFPMEYTKLTLEMTSPEYTDYFHALPMATRDGLARDHRVLYKGISGDLVDDIYDTLYTLSADAPVRTTLLTETEVVDTSLDADDTARLTLRNEQAGRSFTHRTDVVVAATGYRPRVPAFLDPVRDRVRRDQRGRLAVSRDYCVDAERRIFVQNGEEHTHGLTAPDLGFGAWRNATILRNLLGEAPYPIEERIAFQHFGVPGDDDRARSPHPAESR